MFLSLAFLPLLCPVLQEPEAQDPPLPDGMVARLGTRYISEDEFKDYLWKRFNKRAIHEYMTELLIEEEARRYGITVDDKKVQEIVDQREEAGRSVPRRISFEEGLKQNGQDLQMFRDGVAREARRDLLLAELVRKTRVVTDLRLEREFEARYGPGGVKLSLRHVVVMPNLLRAEQVRSGVRPADIDMDAINKQARQMADDALSRIRGGGDFGAIAKEVSHDRTTRENGGLLPQYNGRLYGPAFRDAVMALKSGEVSAIVETGAGLHIIRLDSRVETKLDEVRESLVREILESEPTWQEKTSLTQALQTRADWQTW